MQMDSLKVAEKILDAQDPGRETLLGGLREALKFGKHSIVTLILAKLRCEQLTGKVNKRLLLSAVESDRPQCVGGLIEGLRKKGVREAQIGSLVADREIITVASKRVKRHCQCLFEPISFFMHSQ